MTFRRRRAARAASRLCRMAGSISRNTTPVRSEKSCFFKVRGTQVAVERINYQAGKTACTGALVYDERASGSRPLLLMAPNWLGVTDDAIRRAASMAGSKYVAFVADIYGGGKIAAGPP